MASLEQISVAIGQTIKAAKEVEAIPVGQSLNPSIDAGIKEAYGALIKVLALLQAESTTK